MFLFFKRHKFTRQKFNLTVASSIVGMTRQHGPNMLRIRKQMTKNRVQGARHIFYGDQAELVYQKTAKPFCKRH